jgi:hypothetical protein
MGMLFGDTLVLPIGCSCIAQFQLQLATCLPPGTRSSQLLDWTIATPRATVRMLGRRTPVVSGHDDLFMLPTSRAGVKALPGLYFWHIRRSLGLPETQPLQDLAHHRDAVARFVEQHRHLVRKLGERHRRLVCLWTNVQPNLRRAAQINGLPWSDFVLTPARHRAIRTACASLPADDVITWFVGRAEDVSPALHDREDVVLLDVPRSPTDYRGEPDLFAPAFARMGLLPLERV